MNKRLIDKHSVSIVSSQRMVCFTAESSSEIAAINLLSRIFERNLVGIILPQTANPSWEIKMLFTDGTFVYIYWYESDGTRFNFYFLPEDWAKIDKMLSE